MPKAASNDQPGHEHFFQGLTEVYRLRPAKLRYRVLPRFANYCHRVLKQEASPAFLSKWFYSVEAGQIPQTARPGLLPAFTGVWRSGKVGAISIQGRPIWIRLLHEASRLVLHHKAGV
jgi:hypothetical protein